MEGLESPSRKLGSSFEMWPCNIFKSRFFFKFMTLPEKFSRFLKKRTTDLKDNFYHGTDLKLKECVLLCTFKLSVFEWILLSYLL